MTTINTLKAKFSTALKNANPGQISEKLKAATSQTSAKFTSGMVDAGSVKSGIKTLSQATDDINDITADAVDSIAEITGDVPGLAEDLIQNIDANSSTLAGALGAGEEVLNGKLDMIISSASPEAIARSLKEVTGKSASEIQGALKDIAPAGALEGLDKLDDAISGGIAGASKFTDALSGFKKNFTDLIPDLTGGVITDVIMNLNGTINSAIRNVIPDFSKVPFAEKELLGFLASGKKTDAADLIRGSFSGTEAELETFINGIKLSPPDAIEVERNPAVGTKSTKPYIIGSNNKLWKGSDTNHKEDKTQFTTIDSSVELELELRTAQREMTEVVVHWSDTFTNQDIGAVEIHKWHEDDDGIPYHLVIRRDGTLQRGLPLDRVGSHIAKMQKPNATPSSDKQSWTDAEAENVESTRKFNDAVGGGLARMKTTVGERAYALYKGYIKPDDKNVDAQKAAGSLTKDSPESIKNQVILETHHNHSIGICFIAGYNCPTGTQLSQLARGSDSITQAQMKKFRTVMEVFYNVNGAGQAFGHADLDHSMMDPGFDVQEYVLSEFDKTNINKDGTSKALSYEEIINYDGWYE